jgi:hypothetical protein
MENTTAVKRIFIKSFKLHLYCLIFSTVIIYVYHFPIRKYKKKLLQTVLKITETLCFKFIIV